MKFALAALAGLAVVVPVTAKADNAPQWSRQPTLEDVSAYYPREARKADKAGRVALSCIATARGALTNCQVVAETPANYGFGKSALRLSRFYRLDTTASTAGAAVNVPVSFDNITTSPPPNWPGAIGAAIGALITAR